MIVVPPLPVLGVAGAAERGLLIEASQQLVQSMSTAAGRECRIDLAFAPPGSEPTTPPAVVLALLLSEVASPLTIEEVAAKWAGWLDRFVRDGGPHIVIGTVYRHVADRAARPVLIERIRRLNDLAIALSRRFGAEVADIDRAFALLGSDAVATDYRCTGQVAVRVAGHVLATAMLAGDLTPQLAVALGDRARAAHGRLNDLIRRERREVS